MNKALPDASYYIGLMSGTSLDGIDAVCANITETSFQQIAAYHMPYPAPLRQALLYLLNNPHPSLLQLGTLDHQLGLCYADCVLALIQQYSLDHRSIVAIGNHGQTVFHHPRGPHPFTLQIGDPTLIAARTGLSVVHDFRRMDMALGGQGAPLAPLFHQAVLAQLGQKRAIVNIGGLANVTLLNGTDLIAGFDTGPGNALLDCWNQEHQGTPFDRDGAWAASGRVHSALLTDCLQEPYFTQLPPKSTGKEQFNRAWLHGKLQHHRTVSPVDVQATLTELTALTIVKALALVAFQPDQIIVCGGGARNRYLMQRIHALSTAPTEPTAAFGIDPQWVEASLIAWLTAQHMQQRRVNLQAITGSSRSLIPGCLTRP